MHCGRDTTHMTLETARVQCACVAPTMLEELFKRIQHCCATLRRPRNKRNVGSYWLKSLTGFKLCAKRPFARGFKEEIGIIIHLISINSTLQKAGYVALDAPTSTLRSISGKTCWTGSTRISTNISWRRKVSAINTCITRLTIHLAGINVTITESSRVTSLTCAAHINEFAVSVDFVTFFWGHALTTVVAGAHVNRGTPGCTRSFIVSGNE